jgi:ABC-2 type transport system permease protein
MKQFFSFIQKETYHIMRDKMTLVIMLALPVIMLLILGFAVSTEIRNTSFVVLDESKSSVSQQFIEKLDANNYFDLTGYLNTQEDIEDAFRKGKCKLAIIIPSQFANDIVHTGSTDIQVMVDATDPNESSNLVNYFQMILLQYQQEMAQQNNIPQFINMEVKMLYNPQMISAYNFVPGLIGMMMMLICAMMTSISVVREKELGTMEILLVSPLRPTTIILSKAVPYLVVSALNVISILALAHFILDVPIAGNLFLIMLLSTVFTFSALALGLLISSVTQTQQTAMIASAMGLMLPSMLLSGLIFPLESMPAILQILSYIVPARWFIEALRDVMIKGLGFSAIWQQFSVLLVMTIFLLTISIKKFKNRL